MDPNKILQSDLLDIVFEGRNKDYGAYELRKKYNKRITLALDYEGDKPPPVLFLCKLDNEQQ